jgi:hypothetical protein
MEEGRVAVLQTPAQEIRSRATQVGERLRAALLEVVLEVGGPALRPSRLVEVLGIDKSLASRISRSLRAETANEMLHFTPSPMGLGLFLDAATRRRISTEALRRARAAVAEFQEFLGHVNGGRAGLDALMSDDAVEVRERAERTASQSVHRAMSYLLGFRCETITSAVILQPSPNGRMVDSYEMGRREGIRRLRPSAPVALFSIGIVKSTELNGEAPSIEPLRQGVDPNDPRSLLLPEFCEPHNPGVVLHQNERHTIYALAAHEAIPDGVTVSSAYVVRNGMVPWRLPDQDEESRNYLLHYPCKLLIRDLFIRDDLYTGIEPQIRLEFPGPAGLPRPHPNDPAVRLNQLDVSVPIVSLGRGLSRAGASGSPQHAPMLAQVFRMAGLDPERFRGYRARIMYPVPMITMAWWWALPPAP